MSTRSGFEIKLLAAFTAALVVVALLAGTAWKVLRDADEAARRVMHANAMLESITQTREATVLIESLVRGYIISGDKGPLAERAVAATRRAAALRRMRALTADNPAQQARLQRLAVATAARREIADRSIGLRETEGFEAARTFSARAAVRETREAYLQVLQEMEADERRLLQERIAAQQRVRDYSVVIGTLNILAIVALLAFAFIVVRRQVRTAAEAQRALERHNASLQAARELAEHANAAKDTFLATMSHEIRTPLNGLMGMLELLALSRQDREQAETLAIARDAGRSLRRIIDDILDHARIEAGKLEIVPEPVSLAQLLQRVANTYHAVASAEGVTLRQMADPRLSTALMADPLRLMQVLGNLISNALKFTLSGYVEVRADLVARADGTETVRLSVKDTGVGMTPEAQQRLFQPFEQGSADTMRLYGGTGLGLTICQRLAELMGGTIAVESALHVGTTVTVVLTLPIADAPPVALPVRGDVFGSATRLTAAALATPSQGTLAHEASDGPWALAVDDNLTNRMLLTRQLQSLGLRVHTAANGSEALGMWRVGEFALLITDCNMPVMDGYALARAIREAEAAQQGQGRARIPILAWTANALAGTVAQCQAAGMDDVLTKPAELASLKALVGKWITLPARAEQAIPSTAPASPQESDVAIDRRILDEITAKDHVLANDVLRNFFETLNEQVAEICAAIDCGDLPRARQVSHKLGGLSGAIGATPFATVCGQIETAARVGDPAPLPGLRLLLQQESERLLRELAPV